MWALQAVNNPAADNFYFATVVDSCQAGGSAKMKDVLLSYAIFWHSARPLSSIPFATFSPFTYAAADQTFANGVAVCRTCSPRSMQLLPHSGTNRAAQLRALQMQPRPIDQFSPRSLAC
ncbi:hypothetical protein DENSPDRAFT_887473 [Dentipellis sp. KUC8613]|nr:hypothetical protein DENSPDRAFT_887473 [Dentipellis sp. KUC8613]